MEIIRRIAYVQDLPLKYVASCGCADACTRLAYPAGSLTTVVRRARHWRDFRDAFPALILFLSLLRRPWFAPCFTVELRSSTA
jgi:hypothetical protein